MELFKKGVVQKGVVRIAFTQKEFVRKGLTQKEIRIAFTQKEFVRKGFSKNNFVRKGFFREGFVQFEEPQWLPKSPVVMSKRNVSFFLLFDVEDFI
jgi:hypothetical protein